MTEGTLLAALRGSIPALVTPFQAGDLATIDETAAARLVCRAIAHGSAAIVACGSTGEGPALSAAEHARMVCLTVEAAHRAVPVIAGVGAPSTEAAMSLARAAELCGADALLVSAPPYVRPTQEGLIAHVRAVAAASSLPVVLYDVPSRAGVAFADGTIARLRELGLAVGLKDATADLSRPGRLRRLCGPGFIQLTGDDSTALAHRAMGGAGCISVTANLMPGLCAALHAAFDLGDWAGAGCLSDLLAPMHDALFAESNPIPVKAALGQLGLCDPSPRLPLTRAGAAVLGRLAGLMPPLMVEEARTRAGRPRRAA